MAEIPKIAKLTQKYLLNRKFNADQMANAISIATSFSSGLKQQFGTDIKAFHVGFASQAGVQSALLAKNGGTANQDIWNIERGFIELYGSKFSKKLNNNFKRSDLGNAIIKFPNFIKFWPVCLATKFSSKLVGVNKS